MAANSKEKQREYDRTWRTRHPDKVREASLNRKHARDMAPEELLAHRSKRAVYSRDYYSHHKREICALTRAWKLRHAESVKMANKLYWERTRESVQAKRLSLRMDALGYYSHGTMECACCGNRFLSFLTIDHIDNNGAEHRRQIKAAGGSGLYGWLKRANYPAGFQVLCWNCNCSKAYSKDHVCEHKRKSCHTTEKNLYELSLNN